MPRTRTRQSAYTRIHVCANAITHTHTHIYTNTYIFHSNALHRAPRNVMRSSDTHKHVHTLTTHRSHFPCRFLRSRTARDATRSAQFSSISTLAATTSVAHLRLPWATLSGPPSQSDSQHPLSQRNDRCIVSRRAIAPSSRVVESRRGLVVLVPDLFAKFAGVLIPTTTTELRVRAPLNQLNIHTYKKTAAEQNGVFQQNGSFTIVDTRRERGERECMYYACACVCVFYAAMTMSIRICQRSHFVPEHA